MLPNDKKKQMRLSVISMLRENGMPMRMSEDEGEEEEDEDLLLASNDETSKEEEAKKEAERKRKQEQERKQGQESRPPNLSPAGVNIMKSAFRKQR